MSNSLQFQMTAEASAEVTKAPPTEAATAEPTEGDQS